MGTNKFASQQGMTAYGTRRHLYDPKLGNEQPLDQATISLQMGTNKGASQVRPPSPASVRVPAPAPPPPRKASGPWFLDPLNSGQMEQDVLEKIPPLCPPAWPGGKSECPLSARDQGMGRHRVQPLSQASSSQSASAQGPLYTP